jgi:hypothetical protein
MQILNNVKHLVSYINATHYSPTDGTVVFTTATTLTCSLFPLAVSDENYHVLGIVVKDATLKKHYYFDGYNCNLSAAANVITISNVLTTVPFAVTDTAHYVYLKGQKKAYDSTVDADKVYGIRDPETVADFTNKVDGTYLYYVDMAKYSSLGLQFILTCTITLQGTKQDDGTAAAGCDYSDITSDITGYDSFDVSCQLDDDLEFFKNYRYIRITVVCATGANDADYTIYAIKSY